MKRFCWVLGSQIWIDTLKIHVKNNTLLPTSLPDLIRFSPKSSSEPIVIPHYAFTFTLSYICHSIIQESSTWSFLISTTHSIWAIRPWAALRQWMVDTNFGDINSAAERSMQRWCVAEKWVSYRAVFFVYGSGTVVLWVVEEPNLMVETKMWNPWILQISICFFRGKKVCWSRTINGYDVLVLLPIGPAMAGYWLKRSWDSHDVQDVCTKLSGS